jgi:ATP-dependent RNA helicase DDX31/DBP7
MEKLGYQKMTKIQVKSYVPISHGEDSVLKSETGSGKTMAWWVPILNALISQPERLKRTDGIKVLVIVPVRELALQVHGVIEKVSRCAVNIVSGTVTGGLQMDSEKTSIRKGLNVVVGTPARIVYHLRNTARFSLTGLQYIVFEECDRTLDMGFKKDMGIILEAVQDRMPQIKKVFVSACITEKVEELLRQIRPETGSWLQDSYRFVGFGENLKTQTSPETLKHFYVLVEERKKVTLFLTLLKLLQHEKVIVFASTADQINFLERVCTLFGKIDYSDNYREQPNAPQPRPLATRELKQLQKFDMTEIGTDLNEKLAQHLLDERDLQEQQDNVEPEVGPEVIDKSTKFLQGHMYKIHGYMNQKDREMAFNQFAACQSGVLLCTDVGSRGLDFTGTRVIILFDVAPSFKDYINRVGRTARIGNEGSAISLLYEREKAYAGKLTQSCQAEELAIDSIEEAFRIQEQPPVGNFGQYLDSEMRKVIITYQLANLSRRAFVSFCRAYSRLKDTDSFSLKRLNLSGISKSYGCKSTKAAHETNKTGYATLPDARQITASEAAFLDRKRTATIEGMRGVGSKRYLKSEFE